MKIKFSISFDVQRHHEPENTNTEPPAIYDLSGANVERSAQYDYEPEPVKLGFQARRTTR